MDLGGSLAIASHGVLKTGVSTDLNVSYLRQAGVVGDKLFVEATCVKLGRMLAFTSLECRNSEGQLVARGSHTKLMSADARDPRQKHDPGDPIRKEQWREPYHADKRPKQDGDLDHEVGKKWRGRGLADKIDELDLDGEDEQGDESVQVDDLIEYGQQDGLADPDRRFD